MKTTKRFLSIMLIAIMTFCLSAFNLTVSADHSITVTGAIAGETFKAYKLFAVTYSDSADDAPHDYTLDDDCVLGKNTTAYTLDAFQALTDSDKQSYVDSLYKDNIMNNGNAKVAGTQQADEFGNVTFNLTDGYYLIVNESEINTDGGPSSSVSFVMCDTNDHDISSITIKRDQPTLTKEIQHNEFKDNASQKNGWGSVGDNKIGDGVEFRLTSKVPNYTWVGYQFIIHDELSDGLTVPDKVSVQIGSDAVEEVTVTPDGQKFEIDLSEKIKGHNGEAVIVTYSAKLNTSAQIASKAPGKDVCETNIAYLQFSNNPYTSDTTNTKEVKVYDWTFTVNIEKYNNDFTIKLNGAVFELYDENDNKVFVSRDGSDYKVDPLSDSNEITVGENGIKIKGLDDVYEYKLKETKAPTGYKTPTGDDAITVFKISASYKSTPNELESLTVEADNNAQIDEMTIKIPNSAGHKLVGTGGIGTTIFYIAGGVLMAGAVVLLVVKRRVNK